MFREPRRLEDLPPFDRSTVEVVRKSCAALPPDHVELTREFYRQLFLLAPEARAMFPADMTDQNERLLKAILMTVSHLDQPEMVEVHLRRWGALHRRNFAVTNDLYPYVAHSLVRALKTLLGDLETTVASCWMAVYEWMAAVMIAGADDADYADELAMQQNGGYYRNTDYETGYYQDAGYYGTQPNPRIQAGVADPYPQGTP